jgi:hypothetical protein
MVPVEPESNKTFSKILHFTEGMVSTTMIVTGVSCFGTFLLEIISIASLALICSKFVYTSSASTFGCVSSGIYCRICTVSVYLFQTRQFFTIL